MNILLTRINGYENAPLSTPEAAFPEVPLEIRNKILEHFDVQEKYDMKRVVPGIHAGVDVLLQAVNHEKFDLVIVAVSKNTTNYNSGQYLTFVNYVTKQNTKCVIVSLDGQGSYVECLVTQLDEESNTVSTVPFPI